MEPRSVRSLPPRAVVIECYGGHGECLAFPANALARAGFAVEVWTRPGLLWRAEAVRVRQVVLASPMPWLEAALRLWRAPPAILVVNTATGPAVRNLLLLAHPLRVPTLGVFHDLAKLRHHRSTRLIARLVGARVMLAEHLAQVGSQVIGLPVDHAHLLAGLVVPAAPSAGEVLITVPGSFIPGKRDNDALLALAADSRLDPRIRFILLGRFPPTAEAEQWWRRCIAAGAEPRLTRFTGFVPQAEFDRLISASTALLPLIHANCADYQRFVADKISGTVNLALDARLPLLLSSDLARTWRFGPAVVAYTGHEELLAAVNRFADSGQLSELRRAVAASLEASRPWQHALFLRACRRAAARRRERIR